MMVMMMLKIVKMIMMMLMIILMMIKMMMMIMMSGSVRRKSQAQGRYSVSVTTASPPLRRHHKSASRGGVAGGVSLDSLLPAIFTGPPRGRGRGRSTVRRRRPKYQESAKEFQGDSRRPKYLGPVQASDRQGNGDVRWGSVLDDMAASQYEGFDQSGV